MSDYPVTLKCELCGCTSAILLKDSLWDLIYDFTLAEVLDRLSDLIDLQRELPQNEPIQADWDQLCILLEKATQQALLIAALKRKQGDSSVWD